MSDDRVTLQVIVETDDAEATDQGARTLRAEMLALREVDAVQSVAAPPPPEGAKALDPSVIGALSISLVSGAVPALLGVVSDWHHRRKERCTIRLVGPGGAEIEIGDVDAERVSSVIAQWTEALEQPR